MKRLFIFMTALVLLSSCRVYDKVFGDEIVARVGNSVLVRSDIEKLNIKGLSPEDSARIVNQYIYTWAKDYLLIGMAEKQLSKSDKDVEQQLEEYRRQLLVFRYEKQYVEQRLDTVVADAEYERFYEENRKMFMATVPYVKGVLIKLSNSSPNYNVIRKLCISRRQEDLERLEDLCYTSADQYVVYDDWVSMAKIAGETESDLSFCERTFSASLNMEKKMDRYTYLVALDDVIQKGTQIPLELSRSRIRDIVLSRRKQELLSDLERNLLNDAIVSNKLIIYSE